MITGGIGPGSAARPEPAARSSCACARALSPQDNTLGDATQLGRLR